MKKPDKAISLNEATADYEVISEEITGNFKSAVLKTHSGYLVTCRIPLHSEDEIKKLSAEICREMMSVAYPDIDLSETEIMEIDVCE